MLPQHLTTSSAESEREINYIIHVSKCEWFSVSSSAFDTGRSMDHDVLRRVNAEKEVSHHLQSTLSLSLALKAASKFSHGADCREGAGSFDRKIIRGTFNICYWVQVEGLDVQWVVRFPLLGMLPESVLVAKLNSEVATLKFLQQKTSVRVPRLIGFGLGDEEIPVPFIIIQHVQGIPLNIYWKRHGDQPKFVESVLNSLAQQYLSLLSHPFDRIGSLCLTKDHNGWEIGSAPLSIDQFDLYRDGLSIKSLPPMSSSLEYYHSQSQLFERRINEQRNSVFDEEDALQKYVTSEIFRLTIPSFVNARFDGGPYFLCHLDLHASNVLINKNLEIEAILDWEFASVLPIEIACAPPRCLGISTPDQLKLHSASYQLFASRLEIFITQVHASLRTILAPTLGDEGCRYIEDRLRSAFSQNHSFFAWSASDVRNLYDIVWDHLALHTPLRLDTDDIGHTSQGNLNDHEGLLFESEQNLVDAVLDKRPRDEVQEWVTQRLAALAEYKEEMKQRGMEKVTEQE